MERELLPKFRAAEDSGQTRLPPSKGRAKKASSMKNIPVISALLGLIGVALGAFGAHALKDSLATRDMTDVWQTAVIYHLLHAVVIWSTCQAAPRCSSSLLRWATRLWITGILLFSGSLYFLALGGPRWLGPVTPLGGVALIAGWFCAATFGWRNRSASAAP